MLDKLQGRNGSGEFARRSMKNLQFILDSSSVADVHPITQTIGALLGIVIFPWEKKAFNSIKKKRLEVAHAEGWPTWDMSGPLAEDNKVKTIGGLLKLLRHAVAHGNVTFDSDSKFPSQVTVTFKNFPDGCNEMNWCASIKADELAQFCIRFSACVEDYVG